MNAANKQIIDRYKLDSEAGNVLVLEDSGRAEVASIFAMLGYKVGAEIGVEEGKYSVQLLDTIPDLKLFCIDSWLPYIRHGQRRQDRIYDRAVETLGKYNCEIIHKTSMNAVKDFEDGSLDFVYIDADHSWTGIVNDIVEWEKKVRIGGVVSGHDYWRQHSSSIYPVHVKDVVNAYVRSYGIQPLYILKGEDREPSWFWVKEDYAKTLVSDN